MKNQEMDEVEIVGNKQKGNWGTGINGITFRDSIGILMLYFLIKVEISLGLEVDFYSRSGFFSRILPLSL